MAQVPVLSPQVDSAAVPPQYAQANDYTAQRINRQAFNQVQQGGADVQRASTDVSNIALQTAIDDNERKAKDLDNQLSEGLGKIGFGDGTADNPGFYQQQGENAIAAAPTAKAAALKLQADLAAKANATNPYVAKQFAKTAGIRASDFGNSVDKYTGQERLAANNATSDARIGQAGKNASLYWNNPKALGQQMGIVSQEVADAGLRNGWDKDTVAYKTTLAQSGIIRGAVNGALSAGSIQTAQSIIDANKGNVDGAVQLSIVQDIKNAENAQRIQQEHAVVMADHYQRQAQDKAFGEVAADVMQNKGDANTIANMTRSGQLNPSQGITLSNMLKAADKPEPLSQVSAQTSMDLFRRQTLPDGDPNKVTTRQPIDDAYSNHLLTKADHDWQITRLNDGLTQGGQKLNTKMGDFLKTQESNIINPGARGTPLGNRQNEAAYAYTQWVHDQVAAVQSGKSTVKDPYKLFDATPGNADYLGTPGKIAAFKHDFSLDMNNDFANFGIDPNAPKPPPAPGFFSGLLSNNEVMGFDSADNLAKAVAKGDVRRDWANAYAISKGWARDSSAAPATSTTDPLKQQGELPGQLHLNPAIAPDVPAGSPRPFAPGEFLENPNGSWSSEMTVTVQDPKLAGGKPTVIPALWVVNGKPVHVDEDTAVRYAIKSGLEFQRYASMKEADKAAADREAGWQNVEPQNAGQIAPLWKKH